MLNIDIIVFNSIKVFIMLALQWCQYRQMSWGRMIEISIHYQRAKQYFYLYQQTW